MTRLFAIVATSILAVTFVAAQGAPPPQVPQAPKPAVQGPPPQGQPPVQPQPGQPARQPQAQGQPGRGPNGPAPMGMGWGMGPQGPARQPNDLQPWAGLGLDQAQREKVRDIQRATRDQALPIEDELRFTRRSLHRELYADKRDNAKVTALAAKIAGLEKQLADIHIKQAIAVADLLTPRQRETMRIQAGPGGPGGAAPIKR